MRHQTLRIGITGPIGCGKSTVASWLGERRDVVVVDADEVARAVRQEPDVERRIVQRFGSADPAALAQVVFADDVALRDLEAIVHPAVRPRILAAIVSAESGGAAAVIIEAIKLVEGGLADLCDEVWLVTCDPTAQRARLIGRGSTEADAERRIAAQGDLAGRIEARATRLIDTSAGINETKQRAATAFEQALERIA